MHLDAGMAMAILDGVDAWPDVPAEYSSGAMGFRESLEVAVPEEKKQDQNTLEKAWRKAQLDWKWWALLGAANTLLLLLLVAGRRRFASRNEPMYGYAQLLQEGNGEKKTMPQIVV